MRVAFARLMPRGALSTPSNCCTAPQANVRSACPPPASARGLSLLPQFTGCRSNVGNVLSNTGRSCRTGWCRVVTSGLLSNRLAVPEGYTISGMRQAPWLPTRCPTATPPGTKAGLPARSWTACDRLSSTVVAPALDTASSGSRPGNREAWSCRRRKPHRVAPG